ncbi:NAD(P)/FAD-dependent oxidoreductase [Dorea sp.]
MIRINQMKLNIEHTSDDFERKILKTLCIKKEELQGFQIRKQSIDARKKPDLYYVYSVDVQVRDEAKVKKTVKNNQIQFQVKPDSYHFEVKGTKELTHRPVIIGTGPAGLFCGYMLAAHGYQPILLERGADVDQRTKDVEAFWKNGKLNLSSNVQFGEGGAGTFSDGKLNTLVKDKFGRNHEVLRIFAEHGAPESITYESKPHIGTDVLSAVVKEMRKYICAHGGEVRFHSQVTDIQTHSDNGQKILRKLKIYDSQKQETYLLDTDLAVFAIGHSARDTFSMLYQHGLPMQPKAFAVGVRIEHPQEMINQDQYGKNYPSFLPAAPYKLTANLDNGRGVYTFCMCPGGYVVNASSEEHRLAVNGMSYSRRDSQNANTAVIVTVSPDDFGSDHPLAGVEFQRKLEEAAYLEGNGKVPVQLFGDFCENRPSVQLGTVTPHIKGMYQLANVRNIFPEFIAESLTEGIQIFDHKLPGYARYDAVISGVESRTSSPVRLIRDQSLQSEIRGIYPCGEGAGYAGGITSAAMDGIKAAEMIASVYHPFKMES